MSGSASLVARSSASGEGGTLLGVMPGGVVGMRDESSELGAAGECCTDDILDQRLDVLVLTVTDPLLRVDTSTTFLCAQESKASQEGPRVIDELLG